MICCVLYSGNIYSYGVLGVVYSVYSSWKNESINCEDVVGLAKGYPIWLGGREQTWNGYPAEFAKNWAFIIRLSIKEVVKSILGLIELIY